MLRRGKGIVARTTVEKQYTPEQRFALSRLKRLVELRAQATSLDTLHANLLKRALYSCYLDCLDAGLAAEARQALADSAPGAEPAA
jgi:hypothetical protein